jgi:thioredoxin 1
MGNHTQVFTAENFDAEVLKSSVPVLVDFTATWCGPCQKLAPILDELAVEYAGKVKIGKVDIDQNNDLASRYGIMSVPTVMAFKGGSPQETLVGLYPKSHLKAKIDQLIGAVK